MIGQYYQLIRLGRKGYRSIMSNLTRTADYLSDELEKMGFIIMSVRSGEGLPLVAFRFTDSKEKGGDPDRHYDEFALAHNLRSRAWVVPAYTMAPHTEKMKMLRVVVREDFTRSRCDMLLQDIKLCCKVLNDSNKEQLKAQEQYVNEHVTSAGKAKRKAYHNHSHDKYKVSTWLPAD